jgi:hypothetical protein
MSWIWRVVLVALVAHLLRHASSGSSQAVSVFGMELLRLWP